MPGAVLPKHPAVMRMRFDEKRNLQGHGSGAAFARGGLRVLVAVTLLALALVAGEGRASTYLNGGALSVDGPVTSPNAPNVNRQLFAETSPDGTSRASAAVTSPSGNGPLAHAGGAAGHGWVRAYAYTTLSRSGVYQGGSDAMAGFSDELVFTAPGLAGLQGTVTLGMRIDGTMSSDSTQSAQDLKGSSEARIDFDAESSVDDQSIDRWAYSYSEDGSGEYLYAEEFTLTVGFVFGDPLYVDFSLDIQSNAWGDSATNTPGIWVATGIADFRHTATWTGIRDLRDAQGNPVEAFEVTSASGTDYRGPIAAPEPGGVLLLGTGIAVLLATRLRPRTR
jgi:hypothetical protein